MGVTRLLEYMNWYLPLFIFSHFHILLLIHFLLTLFSMSLSFFFKISFIYFRDRGREGEKRGREIVVCERNIDWLPLAYAPTRTKLATQAWALTGNWTSDFSLCHTNQGSSMSLNLSYVFHLSPCVAVQVISSYLSSSSVIPSLASSNLWYIKKFQVLYLYGKSHLVLFQIYYSFLFPEDTLKLILK